MKTLIKFFREETAATAVEYAVLLALILLAAISGIGVLSDEAGGMWGGIKGELDATPFGD